jgi:hypothetical protein
MYCAFDVLEFEACRHILTKFVRWSECIKGHHCCIELFLRTERETNLGFCALRLDIGVTNIFWSRSRSFATVIVTVSHDNFIDCIKPPPIIEDSPILEDLSLL